MPFDDGKDTEAARPFKTAASEPALSRTSRPVREQTDRPSGCAPVPRVGAKRLPHANAGRKKTRLGRQNRPIRLFQLSGKHGRLKFACKKNCRPYETNNRNGSDLPARPDVGLVRRRADLRTGLDAQAVHRLRPREQHPGTVFAGFAAKRPGRPATGQGRPDAHARIHDLAERHSSEKGERELQFRRHLLGQLRAQCRPDALQRRQAETLAAPAADRQPQQRIRGGSRPQRHRNRRHAGLSRNSVCERDGQDERPDRRVVGGPDGTVESAARSRLDRPQRLRANGGSVQQRLLPADRQRERSGASTAAAQAAARAGNRQYVRRRISRNRQLDRTGRGSPHGRGVPDGAGSHAANGKRPD